MAGASPALPSPQTQAQMSEARGGRNSHTDLLRQEHAKRPGLQGRRVQQDWLRRALVKGVLPASVIKVIKGACPAAFMAVALHDFERQTAEPAGSSRENSWCSPLGLAFADQTPSSQKQKKYT